MTDQDKTAITCYVNEKGMATLKCPNCNNVKKIDASSYLFSKKPFKATCKCGMVFYGRFEFRTHFRKKVRLAGHYRRPSTKIKGDILVENISLRGVGFTCMDPHDLKAGENFEITFWLDNPKSSKIELRMVVKHVSGRHIGAERIDTLQAQPDLGFYLKG